MRREPWVGYLDTLPECRGQISQMSIRTVVFDAFGTLVQLGERRLPYRKVMQWMHNNNSRLIIWIQGYLCESRAHISRPERHAQNDARELVHGKCLLS